MIVLGAIVVTWTLAWLPASHFKVLCQSFLKFYVKNFYVMGKTLSEELFCTQTRLVILPVILFKFQKALLNKFH